MNFNSIKVRLERRSHEGSAQAHTVFQFHKGTIRTHVMSCLTLFFSNFNSIKVRLERNVFGIDDAILIFQFHKGTIRTTFFALPYLC